MYVLMHIPCVGKYVCVDKYACVYTYVCVYEYVVLTHLYLLINKFLFSRPSLDSFMHFQTNLTFFLKMF